MRPRRWTPIRLHLRTHGPRTPNDKRRVEEGTAGTAVARGGTVETTVARGDLGYVK